MDDHLQVVVPVWVNKLCDSCEGGLLKRIDKLTLTSYPPKYNYRCNDCNTLYILEGEYPRIEYRTLNNEALKF